MSRNDSSPTMIIPNGTEIQIDVHGQLSVRTPGNLVIQNSGHYGEIESVGGSIRIEANAEVEAVAVRCAETCYVQGSLTSWKVKAKSIHLEEKAQARIVLQETESLEIGKNANLVGNFASEKDLFLLFSRFAQQLRSLPFYFDRQDGQPGQLGFANPAEEGAAEHGRPVEASSSVGTVVDTSDSTGTAAEASGSPPTSTESTPAPRAQELAHSPPEEPKISGQAEAPHVSTPALEVGKELPDQLFFALVLLEREGKNEAYGSTSLRVVEELVKLLKARDLDTLQHTHRTLFGRIVEPGEDIARAQEMIESYFKESAAEAAAGRGTP